MGRRNGKEPPRLTFFFFFFLSDTLPSFSYVYVKLRGKFWDLRRAWISTNLEGTTNARGYFREGLNKRWNIWDLPDQSSQRGNSWCTEHTTQGLLGLINKKKKNTKNDGWTRSPAAVRDSKMMYCTTRKSGEWVEAEFWDAFYELLPKIDISSDKRQKCHPDTEWKWHQSFLTDVTELLNGLYRQLRGKGELVYDMYSRSRKYSKSNLHWFSDKYKRNILVIFLCHLTLRNSWNCQRGRSAADINDILLYSELWCFESNSTPLSWTSKSMRLLQSSAALTSHFSSMKWLKMLIRSIIGDEHLHQSLRAWHQPSRHPDVSPHFPLMYQVLYTPTVVHAHVFLFLSNGKYNYGSCVAVVYVQGPFLLDSVHWNPHTHMALNNIEWNTLWGHDNNNNLN